MKRSIALILVLTLLLCGCGGPEMGERSDALRQPYEAMTGCTVTTVNIHVGGVTMA